MNNQYYMAYTNAAPNGEKKSTNDLIYPLFEVHALLSLSIIASKQTNEVCLNTMTPKKKNQVLLEPSWM
jgi:hypothetical protein